MSHIEPIDLPTPARLVTLHAEAKRCGFVTDSEADRLKFFAAAEHARAKGTSNVAGLFAAVVRRGLWRFISQADEDAARLTMREAPWPSELLPMQAKCDMPETSDLATECADRASIRACIMRSLESVES